MKTVVIGLRTQATNAAWSAPTRPITAITNQTVSGTSARALTRCRHQCATPSLAEPRPIARPSGERIGAWVWGSAMSMSPMRNADHPSNDSQGGGDREHRPAAGIDAVQLESMAGVPPQMSDAVAQVVEQREAPAEQQHQSQPRTEKALDRGIGCRRIGGCAE